VPSRPRRYSPAPPRRAAITRLTRTSPAIALKATTHRDGRVEHEGSHRQLPLHESYQWSIDGVDFELTVRGDKIIRTPGRADRPAVTLTASNPALADLVTGRQTVADAIERGRIKLKGPKTAMRRMFNVIGFPLVRLGF
jgi:putative sterol carrier protein